MDGGTGESRPILGFLHQTDGPEIEAYNPYTPEPGLYAISETSLKLGPLLQNEDMYVFFDALEPIGRMGHSIQLFEVVEDVSAEMDAFVVGCMLDTLRPEGLGS